MALQDTRQRYGSISRFLHWSVAGLIIWQLVGMVLKVTLGKEGVAQIFLGSHSSVGTLILVLVAVRIVWALMQSGSRPPKQAGGLGTLGRIGHFALYALMLIVPALAVLRMIGNTRAISLFGIDFRGETASKVEWMMAPANAAHGLLGWALLALILGHILMVVIHQKVWGDKTLNRMLGQ